MVRAALTCLGSRPISLPAGVAFSAAIGYTTSWKTRHVHTRSPFRRAQRKAAARSMKMLSSGVEAGALAESTLTGSWAGWACRFDLAGGGKTLRVPDEYLPKSYVEWEVDVWGWQGFTFDTLSSDAPAGRPLLLREAARFMIEAGCGVENVGKEVKRRRLETSSDGKSVLYAAPCGSFLFAEQLTSRLTRVESCLTLQGAPQMEQTKESPFDGVPVRVRVVIDVDNEATETKARSMRVRPEATVFLERRWKADVMDQDAAGHPFRSPIDESTISARIGFPCFGDPKAALPSFRLQPNTNSRSIKRFGSSAGTDFDAAVAQHAALPGGVSVASSTDNSGLHLRVEWAPDGVTRARWTTHIPSEQADLTTALSCVHEVGEASLR